ncbi:hypothetical protein [Streptomyces aurantiacus]|uniref:hypothetical protein n=1 Tax=Streptomyces aurantiacus TaxID=47760 RepID=UPI000B22772D|nr:hypothetical protein [Streptomyces aurantiacus]
MDTTQPTQQPEVRIRVTPLRRLSGGTYVPRGSRAVTAQADEAACTGGRERPARTGGRRATHD